MGYRQDFMEEIREPSEKKERHKITVWQLLGIIFQHSLLV